MNCYTAEFIERFHPITESYIEDSQEIRDLIKARKKELKKKGFIVRTHWYSSLGSYALRAIKYKLGTPTGEVLKEMKSWVRF